MDRQALSLLAAELARRAAQRGATSELHPGQARVRAARDATGARARRLGLLTHRRWGKTHLLVTDEADVCLSKQRARCCYIAQQKTNAKKLFLEAMVPMAEKYGWDYDWHAVDLVWTFRETGSIIQVCGMDDPRAIRLLRGFAWDRAHIDEAQDFIYTDLQHLTMRVLGPGVAERRGQMALAGTPGDVENFFWEVVSGRHPGWIVERGQFLENPYTRQALIEEIEDLVRSNPNVVHEPWFQREYLGRWVSDSRLAEVEVDLARNGLLEWKREDDDRFCLGIDWGWTAPPAVTSNEERRYSAAYVLGTWNPRRYPWFVYLSAREFPPMYVHEHVALLRKYRAEWKGLRIFGDPASEAGPLHDDLRLVNGIPIEDADKREKRYHIERLNSEAALGHLKIYNLDEPAHPEHSPLFKQWRSLVWARGPRGVRIEGVPRHLHDGALYARRGAYLYAYREPEKPDTDEQRQAKVADRMREQRILSIRGKRNLHGR